MVDDPNFKALFVSGFYSDKTLAMMLADLTRDACAMSWRMDQTSWQRSEKQTGVARI